jgi:hypothetical protein
MATGDISDFVGRLRAALPSRWFPLPDPPDLSGTAELGEFILGEAELGSVGSSPTTQTPVLDGVLTGLASVWAWFYSLYSYVYLQARIGTATDVWLDMISRDFLGTKLLRAPGVKDAQYRAQIKAAILQPRGTRAALRQVLTTLTGRAPWIFEPANTTDTGGYNIGGIGYGVGGGYGDLQLPFQAFIVAYRPSGGGIANVAGYGNLATFNYGAGGYGTGAIEYGNLDQIEGEVTDAMIQTAVASVMPEATIGWLAITN